MARPTLLYLLQSPTYPLVGLANYVDRCYLLWPINLQVLQGAQREDTEVIGATEQDTEWIMLRQGSAMLLSTRLK